MEVMHFKTQEERLKYLKGGFEEIAPVEVTAETEADEPKEEEPKEEKPKKAKKGKKKDDTVQA